MVDKPLSFRCGSFVANVRRRRRIGKSSSESFRVVKFRDGAVASCTYNGAKVAPIPFRRESPSPVAVAFQNRNDGRRSTNAATVTNRLLESYRNGRVTFDMPQGKYQVVGGRLESQTPSDDGRYLIVTARVDLPARKSVRITIGEIKR